MIIKYGDKEVELTFKTSQMIKIDEQIGNKLKLEQGAYSGDLKILANLLKILSNKYDYSQSLDLIDEMLESGKSVKEIYEDIFKGINEKAFFMTPLEVSDTPPIDMTESMKKMQNEIMENYMREAVGSKNTLKVLNK